MVSRLDENEYSGEELLEDNPLIENDPVEVVVPEIVAAGLDQAFDPRDEKKEDIHGDRDPREVEMENEHPHLYDADIDGDLYEELTSEEKDNLDHLCYYYADMFDLTPSTQEREFKDKMDGVRTVLVDAKRQERPGPDGDVDRAVSSFLEGLNKIRSERAWSRQELEAILKLTSDTLGAYVNLRNRPFPTTEYKFKQDLIATGKHDGVHRGERISVCICGKTVYTGKAKNDMHCQECLRERRKAGTNDYFYHSLYDRYAKLYKDPKAVKLMESWYEAGNPANRGEKYLDVYDGNTWKEMVWPKIKGCKHNKSWTVHIDGVKTAKRGQYESSVIITVADTGLPRYLRYRPEWLWVVAVIGKEHSSTMNIEVLKFVQELRNAREGLWTFTDCNGQRVQVETAEVSVVTLDSRAFPYWNSQTISPALYGACLSPMCTTVGQHLGIPGVHRRDSKKNAGQRTIYIPHDPEPEGAERIPESDSIIHGLRARHKKLKKNEKPLFKDVPVARLFLGTDRRRMAYCPPHNDVNVIKSLCQLLGNVSIRAYTPEVRKLDYCNGHLQELRPMDARDRNDHIVTYQAVDGSIRMRQRFPSPPWGGPTVVQGLKAVAALFATEEMRLPPGLGSSLHNPFVGFVGFRIGDALALASPFGALLFAALGIPDKNLDAALTRLLRCLGELSSSVLKSRRRIERLGKAINASLDILKDRLPLVMRTYTMHALSHRAQQVLDFGPVFAHSTMYGERMVRQLLRLIPESRRSPCVISGKLRSWTESNNRYKLTEDEQHVRVHYVPCSKSDETMMGSWAEFSKRVAGDNAEEDKERNDGGGHYYCTLPEHIEPNEDEVAHIQIQEVGGWNKRNANKVVLHANDVIAITNALRDMGGRVDQIDPNTKYPFRMRSGTRVDCNKRYKYRTVRREITALDSAAKKKQRGRSYCHIAYNPGEGLQRAGLLCRGMTYVSRNETGPYEDLCIGEIQDMICCETDSREAGNAGIKLYYFIVKTLVTILPENHDGDFFRVHRIAVVDKSLNPVRRAGTQTDRVLVSAEDLFPSQPFLVPLYELRHNLFNPRAKTYPSIGWRAVIFMRDIVPIDSLMRLRY